MPVAVGDRLVGDANGAAGDQVLSLVRVGCEVEVGEQQLILAEHGAFNGLRLLDLHDQVGGLEHAGCGWDDASTGGLSPTLRSATLISLGTPTITTSLLCEG